MRQVLQTVTDATRRLIDEAVANGQVVQCQPFLAPGSEAPLALRDLVTRRRSAWRKANKKSRH